MNIGVVIPSKSNLEGLGGILHDIEVDTDTAHVVVIDNGYTKLTLEEGGGTIIRDTTPSIYRLWNRGADFLRELGCCDKVVFLNDDIHLLAAGSGWLERLVRPLYNDYWVTCPDHLGQQIPGQITDVRGTYRHGGMCGFAFAIDINKCPRFDERYHWWYGDDDFAFRVERAGGKIGRVGGLHLHHDHSTTLNKENVASQIAEDTALFRGIWGDA